MGDQCFRSRREDATSHAGSHRAPVWNQEFQFLVEDPNTQVWLFSGFVLWWVVAAGGSVLSDITTAVLHFTSSCCRLAQLFT